MHHRENLAVFDRRVIFDQHLDEDSIDWRQHRVAYSQYFDLRDPGACCEGVPSHRQRGVCRAMKIPHVTRLHEYSRVARSDDRGAWGRGIRLGRCRDVLRNGFPVDLDTKPVVLDFQLSNTRGFQQVEQTLDQTDDVRGIDVDVRIGHSERP